MRSIAWQFHYWMGYLSHLPLQLGTARLQPCVSIKPPQSGFRSAEGRSEGEAETTDLIAFASPKSAPASKFRQNSCQAPTLPDNSNNPNKRNNLNPKNGNYILNS